ncbi:hypothetical protein OCU04_003535 [Sclerotinia nivalis]|uniref:Uncharacterized protein n=1 Tax=Sclerotinia nivalis TaxID=352851 RepID=A0A9X0DPE0_9HELO|nr:hypothetical protein OCU04_003535 [Sclerotinia nivalis]
MQTETRIQISNNESRSISLSTWSFFAPVAVCLAIITSPNSALLRSQIQDRKQQEELDEKYNEWCASISATKEYEEGLERILNDTTSLRKRRGDNGEEDGAEDAKNNERNHGEDSAPELEALIAEACYWALDDDGQDLM